MVENLFSEICQVCTFTTYHLPVLFAKMGRHSAGKICTVCLRKLPTLICFNLCSGAKYCLHHLSPRLSITQSALTYKTWIYNGGRGNQKWLEIPRMLHEEVLRGIRISGCIKIIRVCDKSLRRNRTDVNKNLISCFKWYTCLWFRSGGFGVSFCGLYCRNVIVFLVC